MHTVDLKSEPGPGGRGAGSTGNGGAQNQRLSKGTRPHTQQPYAEKATGIIKPMHTGSTGTTV
jgi:hypothetical protein